MCGGETVREDGRSRRREGEEEEEEEDEKGDGREEERQASVLVRTDVVITGTFGFPWGYNADANASTNG